ncbi:MAG: hypothetical protein HY747_09110 [Elusimicrobia bacterium]|nr:hypothetical protein [Elusimicrobiota bacterium]
MPASLLWCQSPTASTYPTVVLNKSIYATQQDNDQDGLDDALEYELAGAFSPYLIWDDQESCSLHQTFYQVHPLEQNKIAVIYVLTFPLDCGFRSTGFVGHWGDTQDARLTLSSEDGLAWKPDDPSFGPLEKLSFHDGGHFYLYLSGGKHHTYPDAASCYQRYSGMDGCEGGPEYIEPILADHNVGEEWAPAITWLGNFGQGPYKEGYAGENAWDQSAWNDWRFCGGNSKKRFSPQCDATGLGRIWLRSASDGNSPVN